MHLLKKQFEKPQGYMGNLIGWMMDKKNEDRSDFTLSKLQVQEGDQLLEVGFGSGRTLEKVQGLLKGGGKVIGVDHSEVMVRKAVQRNQLAISQGKMELYCNCLWDFSTPEDHYDTIYASNVHEFWENPVTEIRYMRELLKEGGKLVMVSQPKWLKSNGYINQAIQQMTAQFLDAGFENITSDYQKTKSGTCLAIIGYK